MGEKAVPKDVQEFLRDRINSYEMLESLLLLRAHKTETWTADSVAAKLHIANTNAQEALDGLCEENLLDIRFGGTDLLFKYGPRTPDLDRLVEHLAREYEENRIEIMKLLSSNAVERVRNSAIKNFADAFLLGRKKDG